MEEKEKSSSSNKENKFKPVLDFFKNKKTENILAIILFLGIIFLGTWIRVQPITNGNLIDKTTGDYTPLALDPYYFLRISETLLETDGNLPEIDEMRAPHLITSWHKEILPQSTILIYKTIKTFNPESTLNFANVLNPVVFFVLGLIIFFFLAWLLTKNKWIAVISSFILSIIPPYLYRTLGGFSDHESIGMFGFFLALLFFYCGMKYLDSKKLKTSKTIIWGLLSGLGTMLAIATWGGIAKFLFMIFPIAFLIKWFTKKDKSMWDYVLFYGLWAISFLIFGIFFGYDPVYSLKKYMVSSVGILSFFVLGFSLIETLIVRCKKSPKIIKENKQIASIIGVIILGGIFYQVFIGNIFSMIGSLISKILYPFGTGRVSLTVAENKQPYLTELIGQIGKAAFYSFLAGCFIVGSKIAKGIKEKKFRPYFTASFIFFIIGILFSRTSSNSIFNGTNFISKALFFISFLAVLVSSIYIYRKSEWKIETKWIFIAAWMIPMLLAVRSAIRVFFAIVPFISLMIPLALFEVVKWGKKNKDDVIKMLSYIAVLIVSVMLIITSFGYYNSVKQQADVQTPSYNSDWQKAMGWVRNNTEEGSKFLHWWDYGYWVQTGGNRPTFSDGGHVQGNLGNHIVGRYVLTTPYPETAKSFMKTHNVSYLLIDPTDIGKYSAYSSIGTGKDEDDRTSWLVSLTSNPAEIQETRNGTIRIYQGGTVLDEDIIYNQDGKNIFLPGKKAGMGAIIIEKINVEEGRAYKQPEGVYIYNQNQYRLPIRYLYINGELIDYKKGVEATAFVYPNVYNSQIGQQFDEEGAVIYLSSRTKDSLVAQLYLMNDPNNLYPELELVHEQSDYPFAFNYGGYRGAIKIYKVHTEDMDDILTHEEFKTHTGEYGLLDDFQFIR